MKNNELTPYSLDWWWQQMYDHLYYSKWKYFSEQEAVKDAEITNFIRNRIELKIKEIK